MSDNKELAGKAAVVTGAGRNIGRAIALALADGGASVVINVRSNKDEAGKVVGEIEAAGGKAVAVLGDVADPKVAQALADAAVKAFGRIDILVNNAALRREKSIADMSYEEWREVMGVILDGSFHGAKPACRRCASRAAPSSTSAACVASRLQAPRPCHDRQGRAGRLLARAGARPRADKITANCVVPGAIDTATTVDLARPAHHLTHGTITGERGKPEDVAAMVRFLAGPGGRNVTGQTLRVNAGAYLGS